MNTNNKQVFKKLPPALRRNAILQSAQRCFAEKGFSDTSVQDIADQADLTKGGVYFHFSSKEAIRDALAESLTQQIIEALHSNTVLALEVEPRLKQQMTILLNNMSEGTGFILILSEAVTRHQASLDCIRDYYRRISDIFAQTLLEGKEKGLFNHQRSIEQQVELILTTLSGLALHQEMDACGIHLCNNRLLCIDFLMDIIKNN